MDKIESKEVMLSKMKNIWNYDNKWVQLLDTILIIAIPFLIYFGIKAIPIVSVNRHLVKVKAVIVDKCYKYTRAVGNIQNATLYLNTCHSNSSGSWLGNIRFGDKRIPGTSATLVGSKETIMQSFFNNYNFKNVRGTGAGVSYNRITRTPEPQFFFQHWTIFER